ncbi:MAG: glycosyltransferase family 39 protein [Candidatus Sumerlaeota bacterium]|nr:glycosyltransferase family 39 protein [Candidatus Sumerlaeota bacterium]
MNPNPFVDRVESFLHTRWGWRLAVLTVLALALFARTRNLERPFWIDELITWDVIKMPFDQMIQNRLEEGHLPLFFMIERYWTQATGDALWSMRIPSIAFDMIGVFLLILLGLEGYSRSMTIGAAALMAIHFQAVWAAQIMRPYALISTLAIGSSILLLRLEREGKWRHVIALAVLTAIGVITHATYLFFVCCQVMYLVWNNWPLQPLRWKRPAALARDVWIAVTRSVWLALGWMLWRQWKPFAAYALAGLAVSYIWLSWNQQQHQIEPESGRKGINVDRMYRCMMDVVLGHFSKSDLVNGIGRTMREAVPWKQMGWAGKFFGRRFITGNTQDWFCPWVKVTTWIALIVFAWALFIKRGNLARLAEKRSGNAPEEPSDKSADSSANKLANDAAGAAGPIAGAAGPPPSPFALWGSPGNDANGRAVALTRYAVCWTLGFTLTMFVFSNVIHNKAGHPRYYSAMTGGLCFCFVAVAFLIRKRWFRSAYLTLLLACVLLVTSGWLITKGDGLSDTLKYIEANRKPGEPVLGSYEISTQAAYHYYAPEAWRTIFTAFDRENTDTAQLKNLVLEKAQTTPAGTFWLFLHHHKYSPILDVIRAPYFKVLGNKEVRAAVAYHVQLTDIAAAKASTGETRGAGASGKGKSNSNARDDDDR